MRGDALSEAEPKPAPQGYRPFGMFRLLLAALVMVQHFGVVAPPALGRALAVPATGNIAVLTFFVLSGFIIAESAERFYGARPRAFVVNRALRILPPYLCAALLSIVAHFILYKMGKLTLWSPSAEYPQHALFATQNLLSNIAYPLPVVSNVIGEPGYRFIPYAWAVRIELLFYIVIAAALVATSFFKSFARVLGFAGIALLGAYTLWRVGGYFATTRMSIYFALGVSLYFAVKGSRGAIIVAAIFYVLCLIDYQDYDTAQRTLFFAASPSLHRLIFVEYLLLASCLGAIPLLAILRPSAYVQKLDAKIGGLSYSLYLNQYVALVIVHSVFTSKAYWTLGVAVLLAIALAYVMNTVVEKNTEPLRNAVRGVRLQAA